MKLMHNCQRVSQVLLRHTKYLHSPSMWLHCQNHFQTSHLFHFRTQYIWENTDVKWSISRFWRIRTFSVVRLWKVIFGMPSVFTSISVCMYVL
jgi:hypothetical protein